MKPPKYDIKEFPAFPVSTLSFSLTGMTLRDYFAAKALQGLIEHGWNTMNDEEHAKTAYQIADAMLKAREA